jgi:hypothetical protein
MFFVAIDFYGHRKAILNEKWIKKDNDIKEVKVNTVLMSYYHPNAENDRKLSFQTKNYSQDFDSQEGIFKFQVKKVCSKY